MLVGSSHEVGMFIVAGPADEDSIGGGMAIDAGLVDAESLVSDSARLQ